MLDALMRKETFNGFPERQSCNEKSVNFEFFIDFKVGIRTVFKWV